MPLEVLEEARDELLDWHGSGMSVMEISHRSKSFVEVAAQAEADLRELMSIPPNYKVLFMQGGASAQFSLVPMNLSAPTSTVDYINTGHWSLRGITRSGALLHGSRCRRCRRRLPARSAAGGIALQRPRFLPALHAERNHQRGRIRLHSRWKWRAAGRGHVVEHSVAAHRCREIRPNLRRRAKEYRSLRIDGGYRAR